MVILTMLLTLYFDEILNEGRSYYDLYNSEEIVALALSLPRVMTLQKFYVLRPLAAKPFTLGPCLYASNQMYTPSTNHLLFNFDLKH